MDLLYSSVGFEQPPKLLGVTSEPKFPTRGFSQRFPYRSLFDCGLFSGK